MSTTGESAGDIGRIRQSIANGDPETAERDAVALTQRSPGDAEAWRIAGNLARDRGDLQGAMLRLTKALAADPRNAEAWADLGRIYLQLGQPEQTRQAMERALTLMPEDAEYWKLVATAFHTEGRHADAAGIFEHALGFPSAGGQLRIALAASLLDAGDLQRALIEAQRAVDESADDAQARFVLGTVHAASGRHADAAAAFESATVLDPRMSSAHYNRALALDEVGQKPAAIEACKAALAIDAQMWPALSQLLFMQRQLCDWEELEPRSARLLQGVHQGATGISPFSFLAEPASAADQLSCAQSHARVLEAAAGGPLPAPPARRAARGGPRVGFVSSGFNNHPTALLVAELIERLRDGPLRTVAYATTADDGGAMRRRLRAAFAEFHEVQGLAPEALAERIRAGEIDVLFDLRGYGAGSASATFARRPAPVQVNWLAFPATSGAGFIDYLLADAQVVPAASRAQYSEAVLRLPHCFQPSDTTRRVAEPPQRAACGLPPAGTVFTCFNNSYKITPQVFSAWMRILAAVPGSVLWLLGETDQPMARNLRRRAAAAGIGVTRLVFQPKLAHDAYLALYKHADLFLDTWPYGAHTTASDALWAGVPLLTLPGETFASRVGYSLLHTLGLPALIADDIDDYVARAVRLATQPGMLGALRQRLQGLRENSPLFDLRRFARDFERIVGAIHERARSGQAPADLDLPAV